MLEDSIEVYLRLSVEKHGGRCDKCVNMSRIGWPDRTAQWPRLGIDLVELKKPKGATRGGVCSGAQERTHEYLASCGVPVYLLDTKAKVDQYVAARTQGVQDSSLFSVQLPAWTYTDPTDPHS